MEAAMVWYTRNLAWRFLPILGLASIVLLLLLLASASDASASPVKLTQTLHLNDRLTVKGKGCQPQVKTQKNTKIVILCVEFQNQGAEQNLADTKLTITL